MPVRCLPLPPSAFQCIGVRAASSPDAFSEARLQLSEELRRHGYHLSHGTLYPVLHLEKSGHLVREERPVGGKIRKYYRGAPLGEQALRGVRAKIEELVAEVSWDEEEVT